MNFSFQDLRERTKKLSELGLYVIEEHYNEKTFGNIIFRLANKDGIIIEFIRDRSQVWCNIGNKEGLNLLENVAKKAKLPILNLSINIPIEECVESSTGYILEHHEKLFSTCMGGKKSFIKYVFGSDS